MAAENKNLVEQKIADLERRLRYMEIESAWSQPQTVPLRQMIAYILVAGLDTANRLSSCPIFAFVEDRVVVDLYMASLLPSFFRRQFSLRLKTEDQDQDRQTLRNLLVKLGQATDQNLPTGCFPSSPRQCQLSLPLDVFMIMLQVEHRQQPTLLPDSADLRMNEPVLHLLSPVGPLQLAQQVLRSPGSVDPFRSRFWNVGAGAELMKRPDVQRAIHRVVTEVFGRAVPFDLSTACYHVGENWTLTPTSRWLSFWDTLAAQHQVSTEIYRQCYEYALDRQAPAPPALQEVPKAVQARIVAAAKKRLRTNEKPSPEVQDDQFADILNLAKQ